MFLKARIVIRPSYSVTAYYNKSLRKMFCYDLLFITHNVGYPLKFQHKLFDIEDLSRHVGRKKVFCTKKPRFTICLICLAGYFEKKQHTSLLYYDAQNI